MTSAASSRSNSIEITNESTLNSLRGLDQSMEDGSIQIGGTGSGTSSGRPRKQSSTNNSRVMHDMGRSLNFLNLDHNRHQRRTSSHFHPDKTVGGASPRLALMQLRLRRLKKTSPTERLYQSDSALFSSANAAPDTTTKTKVEQHKGDVWFKSLYPKQGALEKLEEAEQELEESENQGGDFHDHHLSDSQNQDSYNNMNMSGTDLWLFEANQSAPGFLPSNKKALRAALGNNDDEDDTGTGEDDSDIKDHSRR